MTQEAISSIIKNMDLFIESLNSENVQGAVSSLSPYKDKPFIPGLPPLNTDQDWMEGHGEWIPKVFACHYALVLFLAGKRLEGDDHTAMTVNRPKALRDKAHLGSSVGFLDGSLRLSDVSHLQINNAWAEMANLRSTCITEFASYSASDTDFIQDIVYTTMHLLQNSGMQHAKITYGFLKAYDWVVEVPALRNSLGTYIDSIKAASKYPQTIQPYLKLIYGDKIDIFPRKDLEPLVACAVAIGRETNENLGDFYSSNEYASIVEAFLEERERRNVIRTGKMKKEELEFMDMFTPDDTTEEDQE